MFCRNCGKELVGTPDICANCGADPVSATAFCRFCGNATNAQTIWCPKCGSALRVIGKSGEALFKKQSLLAVILKILVVAAIVSTYTFFTLPPGASRTVKSTTSDLVLAATGYTALPLNSISASPSRIPLTNPEAQIANFAINANSVVITVFAPGDTRQLAVYALYRNTAIGNVSGGGRFEDVTDKAIYQSSNEKIATVTASGLVQAAAVGSTNIVVSYTAIPGSANFSATAEGKAPIKVTTTVPVIVTKLLVSMGGKVP